MTPAIVISPATASEFQRAYVQFEWDHWEFVSGDFSTLKRSTRPITCRPGVYIVRAPLALSRVRGSSDVVYIGQAGGGSRGGRQGLGPGNAGPGRLFNTRGPDEDIRHKIESLFPAGRSVLECTFVGTGDPKAIEDQLLGAYLVDHCELPPANHNHPGKLDDSN